MQLLVTGGAGYIGSVVSAQLVAAGHTVTVLDDLSSGHRAALPQQANFVHADLGDRAAVTACLAVGKFDAVLHFAANIEAGESMQAPEKYFYNNTSKTLSFFELLITHGVKSLVFSSTAAVYGDPGRLPIRESVPTKPVNVYGESKLMVERALVWMNRQRGLRYASLRYFNAAGAEGELGEDHPNESHLIPLVLQVAQGKRASISIYGNDYETPDGTCLRDYIHVSDLAAAHLLALDALERDPQNVYNLGNGKGFSVSEVIECARRVTGEVIPAVISPRRPGDPAVLVASSDKIRAELGWQPEFTALDSIISSAWQWRRSHPNGYGS